VTSVALGPATMDPAGRGPLLCTAAYVCDLRFEVAGKVHQV
jgi:hypothetical protein